MGSQKHMRLDKYFTSTSFRDIWRETLATFVLFWTVFKMNIWTNGRIDLAGNLNNLSATFHSVILHLVFSFLDVPALCNIASVSKAFRTIARKDDLCEKLLLKYGYPQIIWKKQVQWKSLCWQHQFSFETNTKTWKYPLNFKPQDNQL